MVLIAYLNQLRDEGKPLGEAVREGSEIRLRPVLTALTLIVLPVLYQWLEERWPAWAATIHRRMKRSPRRRLGEAHV